MSKDTREVELRFEGVSSAEARELVEGLCDAVREAHPDVDAEVRKDDQSTMDFGTTLLVSLSVASITAVARNIVGKLKQADPTVVLTFGTDGSIRIAGSTAQAAHVADALRRSV